MSAEGGASSVAPLVVLLAILVPSPSMLAGQADSVTIRPAPRYAASATTERLLGAGYRHLWVSPVRVQVLDLARFAGGLTPIEPGGGRQTRTLHMRGADGRRYIFRSVDKFVEQVLPDDLRGTFVHDLFQDQMSTLHPSGALILPPLLDAAGVLHVTPQLVVMPDDERLGEHRDEFAGMLGQLEERPNEGPDDTPGFAGSSKVVGMERLIERIEEDPTQRPAAAEYLRARLLDFLVGDVDRGSDQWRWASVERPEGGLLWRPIPRDRDWAFVRSDGQLARLARLVYPKLVAFGPAYPSLDALTFAAIHRDRRILEELDGETWAAEAETLRARLTDSVIADAVVGMPPEHAAAEADRIAAALRQRRDALPEIARSFYEALSGEVDIHATEAPDEAEVEIRSDGSVEIRLASGGSSYFHRRFRPGETREVRLYLLDGPDRAVVRGSGPSPIGVRVIGGPGDDALVDSTAGDAGRVALYAAEGDDRLVTRPGTRVDRRPFDPPADPGGWFERRVRRERFRDRGRARSLRPVLDYGEGAGLVVGAELRRTRYGFRRVPHAHRRWLQATYAVGSGGFGVEAGADRTWENSPWSASVVLAADQYDALRFYGYGNDTPVPGSHDRALVMQDRVRLSPGLAFSPTPGARLGLGLRARYTDPRPVAGSPLQELAAPGGEASGTIGGWVEARLDRTTGDGLTREGFRLSASGAAHPGVWDAPGSFGTAAVEARGYVGARPTLAVRVGGQRSWGAFPVQDAAFIGGKSTVRGFRYQRFAGDGALYGSTELRVPIAPVRLLVGGQLGALGFVDAGRVFMGRSSPGGWHVGFGTGLTFTTLGNTLVASWAYGEEQRLYLGVGSPF